MLRRQAARGRSQARTLLDDEPRRLERRERRGEERKKQKKASRDATETTRPATAVL
jgi:hypothetical protein